MIKTKVLFLCVHNSARSQMAEALLNHLGEGEFEAQSAGFELAPINPICVKAMQEIGLDISNNKPKEVFDLYKQGKMFNYIISVCHEAYGEKCPIFPGIVTRLNWSLPNPADLEGTEEEKLKKVREIRDNIKANIFDFMNKARAIKSNK